MATAKSMKIQAEIDKVKAKISEQQARLKELEQKKLEAENSEIVDIVRGMSIPLIRIDTISRTSDRVKSVPVGNAGITGIGMYAGNSGNTLYCPTGYLELLRLQDRFVYLPEMPYRKVDLDKAKRNVLTQEEFTEAGGKGNVAGWLNTITVENVHPNTTVAIRMKGIAGKADTFTLYAYDKENKLKEVPAELWHIQEEDGTLPDKLTEDTLYEVHVMVEDGGEFDLSDTEKEIKIAVILGNK